MRSPSQLALTVGCPSGRTRPRSLSEKQVWETLNGAQVIVRKPDDATLPPPMEAGPTLREVVWGVKDAEALEKLVKLACSQRADCIKSYYWGLSETPMPWAGLEKTT